VGFVEPEKVLHLPQKLPRKIPQKKCFEQGMRDVRVYIWGPGTGRETAIRGIYEAGLRVTVIRDITALPHNGCRAPKRRRVLFYYKKCF
jgi:small subunit ribosomal protein S11